MATGTILKYIVAADIPTSADLNNYMTTGIYRSPESAQGIGSLSNCPADNPFTLIVTGSGALAGCVQTVLTRGNIYTRRASSGGWFGWTTFTGS